MTEPVDLDRWREIEAILDAALDLPPEERTAFLDRACARDANLRAEVESLLDAHAKAADFMEQPAAHAHFLHDAYRPGQEIGHYRLERELGRGGLGVVYVALDTRLGRRVALKLLPVLRRTDPDARARFRREARAASSLDHPNICTVYEIGESDAGDPYIAMALVEGETLKDRIARGPIRTEEAVELTIQLVRGLAHAHERGLVHRDIKPGNLIVNRSGNVKIVDFGLAKGRDAPTLTREGATPGTVIYMSPEQIRGGDVDARTDIWSVGVVLYEMITGQPPFRGDSDTARAHAILNHDPEPVTAVRAGVPIALEPILTKALEKDPERRYQHVDELPVDLRTALDRGTARIPGTRVWITRPARKAAIALVSIGFIGGAVLASAIFPRVMPRLSGDPVHLSIPLPAGQQLGAGNRRVAVSPDGRRVVYVGRNGSGTQLYVRALGDDDAVPIVGTDGARDPFFGPAGQRVGFFANQGLYKVSLAGGPRQRITDAPTETNRGASWGEDDTIILPLGQWSGLYRVSASGGDPEPVTVPDGPDRSAHFFPQILPDGDVLFTIWSDAGWRIGLLDIETGEWEEIATGCGGARWIATGYLICLEMRGTATTGTVLAARFDIDRRELSGSFVSLPAPSGLVTFDFAVSRNGTLVYATGLQPGEAGTLVSVDGNGQGTPFAPAADPFLTPAAAPDGVRVAVTRMVEAGRQELWLYDADGGAPTRLSTIGTINNMPVWSPDGDRLVFNSVRETPGIYSIAPGRDTTATLLLERQRHILVPGSFSPDGRFLALTELNDQTLGDIWILSVHDGSLSPWLHTPANERTPAFSTDGRWLAYASDESGRDEIYVRPWPGPGAPVQVSPEGGREPAWSRAGGKLYYRRGDAMLAVPVGTGDTFGWGPPDTMFTGRFASEFLRTRNYDVLPDGRFVMLQHATRSDPVRLNVVLHWSDELDRLTALTR